MRAVDALASEVQYLHHIVPIWLAMPADERGVFHVAHGLEAAATSAGVAPSAVRVGYPTRDEARPMIVASFQDHRTAHRHSARPTIFVEHGAGQSYDGDPAIASHPSYSGGTEREGAILFIVPNHRVARRNERLYADAPWAIVGSPRLDPWTGPDARRKTPSVDEPVIAISFHADVALCPETRSAWSHFAPGLDEVCARWRVLGHGHPRIYGRLAARWEALGAEPVEDFDEVLDRADVYCVDNSSTGYEFMATGRPGVWLDAPWYRRDVEHGLRFWEAADGAVHSSGPETLVAAIEAALTDPWKVAERRDAISAETFAALDGQASRRAAEAIRSVVA